MNIDVPSSTAVRVLFQEDPYPQDPPGLFSSGIWPAHWIGLPCDSAPPLVAAYRLDFLSPEPETLRIHVTADEHYELFLDGTRIGRGAERGDPDHWFFDSYDLTLARGPHRLSARVWSLGPASPRWRIGLRPGLLVSPQSSRDAKRIATGTAAWQALRIHGYSFLPPFDHDYFSIGYCATVDAARVQPDAEKGGGDGWMPAGTLDPGANPDRRNRFAPTHLLKPAIVPPRRECTWPRGRVRFVGSLDGKPEKDHPFLEQELFADQVSSWQTLWSHTAPLEIPAHSHLRALVDLEEYVCGFPLLTVTHGKGARLRFAWAESLFLGPGSPEKGNRNDIIGKTFWGIGDSFLPDGAAERVLEVPHTGAGRYVEITIRTADEPLVLERLGVMENRYPLESSASFDCDKPELNAVLPLCIRTVQMSAHDAGIDGPYCECMSWIGDAPQLCLSLYSLTTDERLVRKYIHTFDASRQANGLTLARFPARDRVYIASYSLYWITLIRDFTFWRGDTALLREMMPGVRGVLDAWLRFLTPDGLARITLGWNFIDWVPAWENGVPPGGNDICSIHNLQGVLALLASAELEDILDEPELAARARRIARGLFQRILDRFWNPAQNCLADDPAHRSFSEHAQSLALLTGLLPPELHDQIADSLCTHPNLTRTTLSYRHYLFEALAQLGRGDVILERLEPWYGLPGQGFKTLPEQPEPTRSDCHAWSAHPHYHAFASLLGIRPDSPGFQTVRIHPLPGPLSHIEGSLPHPAGPIHVCCVQTDTTLEVTCTLPAPLTGTLLLPGARFPLRAGTQKFRVTPAARPAREEKPGKNPQGSPKHGP